MKVIGIADSKRSRRLPDVPTLAEYGIRDAEAAVWFGMSAPARTPGAIIEKLNLELNRTLTLPDVRERFDQLGLEAVGGTPAEFGSFIKSEAARLEKLIRAGRLNALDS